MQGDGAIVVERLGFFCVVKKAKIWRQDIASKSTNYVKRMLLFPQCQAVKDNDYDCMVDNNLEMNEVMILHRKNCFPPLWF